MAGMHRNDLLRALNILLEPDKFRDYAPNGLQVEGRDQIGKIVTGVTACQQLLEAAIARQADAVLVHHGYFWKGESPVIRGMKKRRLQSLLSHDISLFAYHLPLDFHPQLGNNAQLANLLGLTITRGLEQENPLSIAVVAEPPRAIALDSFKQQLSEGLERDVLAIPGGDHPIRTVALCTGAAQDYIDLAAEQGIDAFITGEVSERTVHTAREMGIHFFACGHHATERGGVMALGDYLGQHYPVEVEFVDIPNPV